MKKEILFILSLSLIISSCEEETAPSINLSQTEITISSAGGSQKIPFESNMNWTAKSSANWCDVSPSSGVAANRGTNVTLSANNTYDTRSCVVIIKTGNLSKAIIVNQGSNLGLLVSQDKYILTSDSVTIEMEVKTNVEFDVTISNDWIARVPINDKTSNKMKFNIAENDSHTNREGSITINQKEGALSSTIKIYQSKNEINWKDFNEAAFEKTASKSNFQKIESELKDGTIAYRVIKSGKGKTPLFTNRVKVLYSVWYKQIDWDKGNIIIGDNGNAIVNKVIFDSTANRDTPSTFEVYALIDGFSTALQHMKEGDVWEVWMPWTLGYGELKQGPIPAYTTLVFEIELLEVL